MSLSLSQVLAQGGHPSSFNLMPMVAALAVVCVAVLSAAKGYEIYRRRRWVPTMVEEMPDLSEIEYKEKLEKLSFMVDELKREKKLLMDQNLDLQNQLRILESYRKEAARKPTRKPKRVSRKGR